MINKMFEKYGVVDKPTHCTNTECAHIEYCDASILSQKEYSCLELEAIYPKLTAEKVLGVINLLCSFDKFGGVYISKGGGGYSAATGKDYAEFTVYSRGTDTLEEALADLLIKLYDQLTEEQREQVREAVRWATIIYIDE